jgi:outer membrane autotransporter protein
LGYEINSNLAIEGMLASGLSGSSVKVNGQTVAGEKMKIGNSIGLYVKPKIKLTDQVEVFARAGVVKTRIAASFVDNDVRVKETSSDSGASFGAGISYSINPKASLNADYMQYYSKEGVKIRGLTLGVGLKF